VPLSATCWRTGCGSDSGRCGGDADLPSLKGINYHGPASADDHGFTDQCVNSRVVEFWLFHARRPGIRAVLVQSTDGSIYSLSSGRLTATGRVTEAAS
jgi:hypothetical protein